MITQSGRLACIKDRIIVRQVPMEDRTPGGLYIPECARDIRNSQLADVVCVGPGRLLRNGERVPVQVKPGDRIYYHRDAGWDVEVGGEKLMMLPEEDVLGVVEQ